MDRIKVAKSLVKLAKSLIAKEEENSNIWHVWDVDCWGNEQDGWEFNDRSHAWTFECESNEAEDIQKAFEKSLGEHGCDITKLKEGLRYDWDSEDNCNVHDKKTDEYYFQINKEMGW